RMRGVPSSVTEEARRAGGVGRSLIRAANGLAAVIRLRTVPPGARCGSKEAARIRGSKDPHNRTKWTRPDGSRKDIAHGSKVGHRADRKPEHHDRDGADGEAGGRLRRRAGR